MQDASKLRHLGTVLRAHAVRTAIEGLEPRLFFSGDAASPTVIAADFVFNALRTPQTITITFSEDVSKSLDQGDIQLDNLTTGTTVPQMQTRLTYDKDTNVASINFNVGGSPGGPSPKAFPDGNYHLTLPAGSVEDDAGNPLADTFTFDFFAFAGDANRDRVVNVTDLGILATNWLTNNRTFSEGDFNYNGVVEVSDLGILAGNYRQSLPAPAARVPVSSPTMQLTPSITSNTEHATVLDQIDEL